MHLPVVEVELELHKSGSVVLDANGNGVLTFDPDNARQRWEVTTVDVTTNQAANATVVPIARLAKNTSDVGTLSQGNQRGATWSANQDTWTGLIKIGPPDYFSVLFSPPPGSTASQIAALAGVTCYAVVTGAKYTRRG